MAELSPLKQFVPSSVCLKCEGCCRFQSETSIWRPSWDKKEFIDDNSYVTTIKDCGQHLCRFFNKGEGSCRTYHERPFECELYPFLLSKSDQGIKVYVHLACPYIQDTQGQPEVEQYVGYLRDFFNQTGTKDFLSRNTKLLRDYSSVEEELQYLFTIPDDKSSGILSHKPQFDEYVNRGPKPLSTYHFSSIFAWEDYFDFTFEIIDDRLCVFAWQGKDSFLYLPPLGGEISLSTLNKCFEKMGKSGIARAENFSDNQLIGLKGRGYNAYLKSHEYVYRRSDLTGLAGQAYKSKRHDVNLFEHSCPNSIVRLYQDSDLESCKALYKRWAQNRTEHHKNSGGDDPIYLSMLEENQYVHAKVIKHSSELGLTGRVLCAADEVIGYTFGYALDDKTFCILFEVTDLKYPGSAAYIFNQMCSEPALSSFEFINTMDDFGLPNVAAAKSSYHPTLLLPTYNLTKEI
jgi:uncharacterized protein